MAALKRSSKRARGSTGEHEGSKGEHRGSKGEHVGACTDSLYKVRHSVKL